MYMDYAPLLVSYSKCRGGNPPISHHPKTKVGGRKQTNRNLYEKRRVGNLYGPLRTRLEIDVTSATSYLEIEEVKDGDGQDKLTGRLIKIQGENGGKEKGTVTAAHTTALEQLACPDVDACCECRPTSTCKTARCECCKADCACVSCCCLGRCYNVAPQT